MLMIKVYSIVTKFLQQGFIHILKRTLSPQTAPAGNQIFKHVSLGQGWGGGGDFLIQTTTEVLVTYTVDDLGEHSWSKKSKSAKIKRY